MADIAFRITVSGAEESAQQIDNVRKSLQGVDAELTGASIETNNFGASQENLSATQKQTVVSTDNLTGSTHQLTDAIGDNTQKVEEGPSGPPSKNWIEQLTGLTKGQLALAAGLTAANIAIDLAAAAISRMVENAKELFTVQGQINKQIAAMDLTGAEAALSKTADSMRQLAAAEQATIDVTRPFGGAIDGLAILQLKLADAFGTTTAQAKLQVAAVELLWETYGRGAATIAASTKELQAQDATLKTLAANAPSISALTDIFADQERVTRAIAQATIDLKVVQADAALSAAINEALVLEKKIGTEAAVKAIERATEAYDIKRRGFAADELKADQDIIAQKESNAKKLGELQAKQILDAAKIIDIENQIALEVAKTGFSREETIERVSALELKRITEVYNAHKAANAAILASLPYGGTEWQAAYSAGLALDAQFNLDRLKGAQKTAEEWIKLETQRFEEEKKLYEKAKELDEAKFQLRKVLGEVSLQDEVDRLRKQADAYEANTIERVNAEIKWATAAKKLRVEVSADDGKALEKAREQYGLYADDIIKFGLTAGPAAVAADNDITGALKELIIQGDLATASQDKLGKELADLGVGIVEGLKNVRKDSMTEVEGLITDIGSAIDTGASRLGDKIYQGLIDRLKSAIDAEALAS